MKKKHVWKPWYRQYKHQYNQREKVSEHTNKRIRFIHLYRVDLPVIALLVPFILTWRLLAKHNPIIALSD
jgi:hypothetical protein